MQDRINYLGGTDAAPILGLSRYKTILELWAEKTGQIEPEDISKKLHIRLGHKLEKTVAELFMEETGKKVVETGETFAHPKYEFIRANIDRQIVGENAILECKTTSPWNKDAWKDEEIPQEYILQCMHYMAVTGAKVAYIAVLIGNQDFKWKLIERDEKLIAELIIQETHFWENFVKPKVMPMKVYAQDKDIIAKLFPYAEKDSKINLGDVSTLLYDIGIAKGKVKALEHEIMENENKVKIKLGENEAGETNNHVVTWKNQLYTKLNTKLLKKELPNTYNAYKIETDIRVLRIKEKKGDK
jgi:putative phage-type endonuclease